MKTDIRHIGSVLVHCTLAYHNVLVTLFFVQDAYIPAEPDYPPAAESWDAYYPYTNSEMWHHTDAATRKLQVGL